MTPRDSEKILFERLAGLSRAEEKRLSPYAVKNDDALRRREETLPGYRQQFSLDADRILYSRAYTRYIDKTQVFSLVDNDHITHRVLHVQLVSRIARTIGRFLYLNEDLIEAIALGHDIGHTPFGHDGETILSELCVEAGLPPFRHNLQSVRFLDKLERQGRGWNLTVQTLDGILCHDGEVHSRALHPDSDLSFSRFDEKIARKESDPECGIIPSTLEGCVMRLADTIAYIGRDIEDAITLGLISRNDIPAACRDILGETNGTIVYALVTDLLTNSRVPVPGESIPEQECTIGFSEEISNALQHLKKFNYDRIYFAPQTKKHLERVRECYRCLFDHYVNAPVSAANDKQLAGSLPADIEYECYGSLGKEAMARDFIAGMTDDYFLKQAAAIGCMIPEKQ